MFAQNHNEAACISGQGNGALMQIDAVGVGMQIKNELLIAELFGMNMKKHFFIRNVLDFANFSGYKGLQRIGDRAQHQTVKCHNVTSKFQAIILKEKMMDKSSSKHSGMFIHRKQTGL
jgi:hypothetical protein